LGKNQHDLFRPLLSDFIDLEQEFVLLPKKIDWIYFEKELAVYFTDYDSPAMTKRLMVSTLLLENCRTLAMRPWQKHGE